MPFGLIRTHHLESLDSMPNSGYALVAICRTWQVLLALFRCQMPTCAAAHMC